MTKDVPVTKSQVVHRRAFVVRLLFKLSNEIFLLLFANPSSGPFHLEMGLRVTTLDLG
jgi:hypothetical protein